jgi:hypothetical protein
MTTRPGFVWDATANEWVNIGQAAVLAPVKYQATAPTSPATGDIWIESDVDVPSIDSAQFLRWRKTMTGGETSLSGNDDLSLSLAYTPGYEQLYINGVLQVRGQDYTATTGTTVTGLTALVAGDTVEIFSAVARTVADVYTQTQSDARFAVRNGPAFSVFQTSGQSFPNSTFTKVTWNQVRFDTNSNFDAVTNHRFTPQISGYYQINANLAFAGSTVGASQFVVRKNNSDIAGGSGIMNNNQVGGQISLATLIYMNGSTDYLELWAWQNSGGSLALQTGTVSNGFTGFLARQA